MTTAARALAALGLAAGVLSGCTTIREVLGVTNVYDPSVEIKSAEPKWLLIRNPRYGSVASEPEYIWVEEDKVPTTLRSLVMGKSSLLAPPEVVAKYGAPPGGGRVSPRQKLMYQADTGGAAAPVSTAAPASAARNQTAAAGGTAPVVKAQATSPPAAPAAAPAPKPTRGYVVFVDTSRVVIDLTAQDGVRPGTVVSLRRDRIPIVHPITGEMLGELDEEVATGQVTEVRERFSIVELSARPPGVEVRIKDRVVIR